jgi:hypothetical protein
VLDEAREGIKEGRKGTVCTKCTLVKETIGSVNSELCAHIIITICALSLKKKKKKKKKK